jgi:hypothetical protein
MTKAYISRVHFDQHVVEFLNCVVCRPRHHSAYVDAVIAQEEGSDFAKVDSERVRDFLNRSREQPDPCVDCAGGGA